MGRVSRDRQAVQSKLELLLEMSRLQTDCFSLLSKAELAKSRGDLDLSVRLYDAMIAANRRLLAISLLHNKHHENPVDTVPTARTLVNALLTQGDLRQSQGKADLAEEHRDEATAVSREHLGLSGNADVERSQAAYLTTQGHFNEALVKLAKSRDFFLKNGDMIKLARTTLDMADILQWLGDYWRALSEVEHASSIVGPMTSGSRPTQQSIAGGLLEGVAAIMSGAADGRKVQDSFELYRIMLEVEYYEGLINKAVGRYDEAETNFGRVWPDYKNWGVGPAIEFQFASILSGKGKHKEALDYARRLEPIFMADAQLRPKLAAILKIQGEALLKMGEPGEAAARLRVGIDDLDVHYDPDLLWRLQWLQGDAFAAGGQSKDALNAYTKAVETVNSLRRASLGYRLDSTFLKDKVGVFESAIDLASADGLAEESCKFMEMIKSRALAITLSTAGRTKGDQVDEMKGRFNRITEQLDAIEYRGYREGQTEALRDQHGSLLAERSALLERIRFSDPRWRGMREPREFDMDRTHEILSSRGQAALSLFLYRGRVAAVLLKDSTATVDAVEISEQTVARLGDYQRNLQSDCPDPRIYDISKGLAVGAKHLIPAGLLRQAIEAESLLILPHGPLHLIPWSGLIYSGKRMFEYCPVGVLPNLCCMESLSKKLASSPRAALVGGPDYGELPESWHLPHAQSEIGAIEGMYRKSGGIIGNVLLGKRANEEEFWALANDEDGVGGVLHIACHGTVDAIEPMNSGLLLADSKIDAAEISLGRLGYDEVVLSACSSGWRPTRVGDVELSGDDILGLPGAFLEAGAKSVLVSIPRADDAASCRFMTLYHENRIGGKSPLFALQETQKAMLADCEFEPYTWCGYTVYGCQ